FENWIREAAREVPGSDVRACVRRKFGIERQEIPNSGRGFGAAAEMPTGRRHYKVGPKESRDVHPVRTLEGLLVFTIVEMIPEWSEMHPAGVVRIKLHCAPHDRGAALELAGVHNLQSQDSERVGIERVQRHCAFRRRAKSRQVLPKEMRLRQRNHRELV